MAHGPKSWDMKEVNAWWKRGLDKERERLTNRPAPHKGDKTSVPVNFSNFAPSRFPLGKPRPSEKRKQGR